MEVSQAGYRVTMALTCFGLSSGLVESLYYLFGSGGGGQDAAGLLLTLLLLVGYLVGWPLVFCGACCHSPVVEKARHGCCCQCCSRCCCCLPALVRVTQRLQGRSPKEPNSAWQWAASFLFLPVLLLLVLIPLTFVRVMIIVVCLLRGWAFFLATPEPATLDSPSLSSLWHFHNCLPLVAAVAMAMRWCFFSANVFLWSQPLILTVSLLGGAFALLEWWHTRSNVSQVAVADVELVPSAEPDSVTRDDADNLEMQAVPASADKAEEVSPRFVRLVAVVYSALFMLAQWVALSPAPVLSLAQEAGSKEAALLMLCVFGCVCLATTVLSSRPLPSVACRSSGPVGVCMLVGTGMLLADLGTASLAGGVMLSCTVPLMWSLHRDALFLILTSGTSNILLFVRVCSGTMFLFLFLTSIDWLGALPSSVLFWCYAIVISGCSVFLSGTGCRNARDVPLADGGSGASLPSRVGPDPQADRAGRTASLEAGMLVLIFVVTVLCGALEWRAPVDTVTLPITSFDGTLRVVNFNVHRGYGDGSVELNFEALRGVVAGTPVLGFQESASFNPMTGAKDMISAVVERTGHHVYRNDVVGLQNSFDGTAILSLYVPSWCVSHNMPWRWPFSRHTFAACGFDLNATVHVMIVSMHPTLTPTDLQLEQVEWAADKINELSRLHPGPVVVMGDFNADSDGQRLKALREVANLTNVLNPGRDPNFDYPVTRPASGSKVDHIFSRGFSSVLSARVLETGDTSDHLAVEVVLRV